MLLEARRVSVFYGKIRSLNDVSLEVDTGEVVTLIGANGSGKTTMLKALSGLLELEAGDIIFDGVRINGLAPHQITRRGLVQIPEGRRIFPLLSVEENLLMGAFFRKDRQAIKNDCDKVFNYFPILKERRKQLGGTLSGGEQQMLAVGRALLSRPKLLMLDEPSMGLAPLIVSTLFSVIQEINRSGVTILLVEQNANAALSVAHRGYVLETGSIVLKNSAKNLLNDDRVKCCYLGVEEIPRPSRK